MQLTLRLSFIYMYPRIRLKKLPARITGWPQHYEIILYRCIVHVI